jgi:hypothetical protein
MFNLYSQSQYSFTFLSEEGKMNFSTGFPLFLPSRGVDFVTVCRPPTSFRAFGERFRVESGTVHHRIHWFP